MLRTDINRLSFAERLLTSVVGDDPTRGGSDRQPSWGGSCREPAAVSAFDDQVAESWAGEEIIGPSTDLRRIRVGLRIIAQTDSPVLIMGESGTCKEVVARSLHALSQYADLPFVHVNCQLARSEEILAALMKPAAGSGSRQAAGSEEPRSAMVRTVFLEGVSVLSAEAQNAVLKLLHLADGDRHETIPVVPRRVRLIASSEEKLSEGARMGSLFAALNRHPETHLVTIPALRDRRGDIPMLVQRFLEQHSQRHGEEYRPLSKCSLALLQVYPWPGNIRELWQVMVGFMALREPGQSADGNKPHLNNGPSLCRQPEAVRKPAEDDDSDLIVASLLQAISRRSRGPSTA